MPRKRKPGPRRADGRLIGPDVLRLQETIALERARGGEVEKVRGGPIRMLSRDGLLWAGSKGSVSADEMSAALWFRATHQMAAGTLKSALNGLGVGRIGWAHMGPGDRKVAAYAEMKLAERALADPKLVTILRLVAGDARTFMDIARGDPAMAKRLELLFVSACEKLARHTRSRPVSWLDAA